MLWWLVVLNNTCYSFIQLFAVEIICLFNGLYCENNTLWGKPWFPQSTVCMKTSIGKHDWNWVSNSGFQTNSGPVKMISLPCLKCRNVCLLLKCVLKYFSRDNHVCLHSILWLLMFHLLQQAYSVAVKWRHVQAIPTYCSIFSLLPGSFF